MGSLRSLERMLYQNECNDVDKYPKLDEELFNYMDIEAGKHRSDVMCFTYYRHCGRKAYVDIYIWDVMLPDDYQRFVLEKGYSLSEEEEEKFLNYIVSSIEIEGELLQQVVNKISKEYPEIHLLLYPDKRHTLLHLYYTMHRTRPYEILFKSNLNYLAADLDKIDGYNLLGSSPEKIFDIQLGMLRALNSPTGVKILEVAENREIANKIYARYHNLICGKKINKYQWKYLEEQTLYGKSVEKRMFDFLGTLTSDYQYYIYLRYMEYRKVIDDYCSILPEFPDTDELKEHMEVCGMIEWYIEHERMLDLRLKDKAGKYQEIYAYESDDYLVKVPSSVRELLSEAEHQHNCLYRYVLKMAYNDSVILLMREKRNLCESLVTIEVKNGVICQALRSFNCLPDKKQKEFLERFAEVKKLDFYFEDEEDVMKC